LVVVSGNDHNAVVVSVRILRMPARVDDGAVVCLDVRVAVVLRTCGINSTGWMNVVLIFCVITLLNLVCIMCSFCLFMQLHLLFNAITIFTSRIQEMYSGEKKTERV